MRTRLIKHTRKKIWDSGVVNLMQAIDYLEDVDNIIFSNYNDFYEHLYHMRDNHKGVWLACEEGDGEIIVTEDLQVVITSLQNSIFAFHYDVGSIILGTNNYMGVRFYLHRYDTYEDAYKSSLEMKEINPKCYNK